MKSTHRFSVSARILSILMIITLSLAIAVPVQAAPSAAAYAAVFDSAYYASRYPDLQAAFGNNEAALLNHFVTCGMAEGRQGNAEFNVQFYQAKYPDLQAAFGNDLTAYYMHYINCGKAEGRVGNGASGASAGGNAVVQINSNAFGGTTASSVVTGPTAANATAKESEFAYQVLAIMNQVRAQNGLSGFTTTQELMNTAQQRSTEIISVFSHYRPDGTVCFTAFDQNGVTYRAAGENIAAGQLTAEQVMNSWMNSSGHRANILNAAYNHVGIGCDLVDGGYGIYWTQCFTN